MRTSSIQNWPSLRVPRFSLGPEGGRGPREQGFRRDVTGSERQGNQFAPPVANCCGGRGNILWRACEFLAAAAKRHKTFGFWRCFILKKYRPYRMQRYKKKRRNARKLSIILMRIVKSTMVNYLTGCFMSCSNSESDLPYISSGL